MEIKKSPKADLQNKKMLFLEIGLIIALVVTGIALSVSSKPKAEEYNPPKQDVTETETVASTTQDEPEPEPVQEKVQAKVLTDVLNIVEDNKKIDNPINFISEDEDWDMDDFLSGLEDKEEEIVEEEIFVIVEKMPTFQGGDLSKFRTWVMQNVKYPQIALENGIQGNVVVQFVVEKDGKISNVKVLQSPDRTLTDAAIAVLEKANSLKNGWKPGQQRNKPVRVKYNLPISFKISQ